MSLQRPKLKINKGVLRYNPNNKLFTSPQWHKWLNKWINVEKQTNNLYRDLVLMEAENNSLLLKHTLHVVISFQRHSVEKTGHFTVKKPDSEDLSQVIKLNKWTAAVSHGGALCPPYDVIMTSVVTLGLGVRWKRKETEG